MEKKRKQIGSFIVNKNKKAYQSGLNPTKGYNDPLWEGWNKIEGKDCLIRIWPFNSKWGVQHLIVHIEVDEEEDPF